MRTRLITAATLALVAGTANAQQITQKDDLAVGWSQGAGAPTAVQLDNTVQVIRPAAGGATGTLLADPYNAFPFIQSVSFDNTAGVVKNPSGFIIAQDNGTNPTGTNTGQGTRLYQFATNASASPVQKVLFNGWGGPVVGGVAPAPIGPTWADFPGLQPTRAVGAKPSPDNTKIAFTGFDNGQVYIFDYNAATATVSNARQTTGTSVVLSGRTQEIEWLDNNTIVAIAVDGFAFTINATGSPVATQVATGLNTNLGNSEFSSLTYLPGVSPFLYYSYSNFNGNTAACSFVTTNRVKVINPANWTIVKEITLNNLQTLRTIRLNSAGDLFVSAFGGNTGAAACGGAVFTPNRIHRIAGASNPNNLVNDTAALFYEVPASGQPGGGFNVSFNGFDVAAGLGGAPSTCYANCDGSTNVPALNAIDFSCFLTRYRAGESYANCDGSTNVPALNALDFGCFLNRYRNPEAGTNCTN